MKKMSSLSRQRLFAERKRAAGFIKRTVWVCKACEAAGTSAAKQGEPCHPLNVTHPVCWTLGWVKGKELK